MFEEAEQEDTFVCNICDQEVDIDDIEEHIRPCIVSQEENFGEEEALQIFVDIGLVPNNIQSFDIEEIHKQVMEQMGIVETDNNNNNG